MSKPRKDKDSYTITEVGTLVESVQHNLFVIGERVETLCEDVSVLKEDVSEIQDRLTTVEDVIRVSIPQINSRLSRLEAKVGV